MTEAQRIKAKRDARAFMVWQRGNAVGWDCTAADIADELRLSVLDVASICRSRGWPIRKGAGQHEFGRVKLVQGWRDDLAPYNRLANEAAE